MMMVAPVMSEADSIDSDLSWVNENEGGSSDVGKIRSAPKMTANNVLSGLKSNFR